MSVAQVNKFNQRKASATLVINGCTFYQTDNHFYFLSVNWNVGTRIHRLLSLTTLSNNRVVVCGTDAKETKMVKYYDIRIGSELDCAELKHEVPTMVEVKRAGRLSLAVSSP